MPQAAVSSTTQDPRIPGKVYTRKFSIGEQRTLTRGPDAELLRAAVGVDFAKQRGVVQQFREFPDSKIRKLFRSEEPHIRLLSRRIQHLAIISNAFRGALAEPYRRRRTAPRRGRFLSLSV